MPIYEYHCTACDTVFEEWHKQADNVMEEPCPQCHAPAHRQISNTSFVLKGGGWYVTEYGNRKTEASSAPSASSSPASPAGEAKTAAETPSATPSAAPTGTASSAPSQAAD